MVTCAPAGVGAGVLAGVGGVVGGTGEGVGGTGDGVGGAVGGAVGGVVGGVGGAVGTGGVQVTLRIHFIGNDDALLQNASLVEFGKGCAGIVSFLPQ